LKKLLQYVKKRFLYLQMLQHVQYLLIKEDKLFILFQLLFQLGLFLIVVLMREEGVRILCYLFVEMLYLVHLI